MRIVKLGIVLYMFLVFSSCKNDRPSVIVKEETLRTVEDINSELLVSVEAADEIMAEATKSIVGLSYDVPEGNQVFYRYLNSEIKSGTVVNLSALARIANLLNSKFTRDFLRFAHKNTVDLGVKEFCINSMFQFIEGLRIDLEILEKNLELINSLQSSSDQKILFCFNELKGHFEKMKNATKALGTMEEITSDVKKANAQIAAIIKGLDDHTGSFTVALNSLSIVISESI